MKDIIRLLIVALIGYGLYTAFMDREIEVPEELDESGTARRCVQRLEQAGKDAAKAIRIHSGSSVDMEAWQPTYKKLRQHLSVSTAACNCERDACLRGRKAIEQLRTLVTAMHDEHSTVQKPFAPAGDHLEAFKITVEEAKALDR